jgi:AraC family transcriptional regulator of adaptative response/methylated-DNA-[protein]-cysteine methyltransferase
LLRLPEGTAVTYADVARAVGQPRAARAVGTALGRNPVGVLIPCHRVLRSTGAFGGYRWGEARKRALLAWEAARTEASAG